MEPIHDKAEIVMDLADEFVALSFSEKSSFDATNVDDGLVIKLKTSGEEPGTITIHLHHYLLADILKGWARSLASMTTMEPRHKLQLLTAVKSVENELLRL